MQFEYSGNELHKISADAIVIFAWQGEKNKKLSYIFSQRFNELGKDSKNELTRLASLDKFSGKRGEILTLVPRNDFLPTRVIVLGLGKMSEFVADDLRRAVSSLISKTKKKLSGIIFALPGEDEEPTDLTLSAQTVTEAVLLGSYAFAQYKTKEKEGKELSVVIFAEQDDKKKKQIKDGVTRGEIYAKATIVARDLVNETPTIATPTYLAKFAEEIAKSNGQITCKVLDKSQAEKMGMHAFLGIARAADTPPKFIHLEYTPKGKSEETIAVIGKGITFDSGGISIKPGDSMMDMKMDMSGAALVLGVFSVIAKLQPKKKVIGLIAATPNLISGSAIVPGDVVKAMNGKTIEILNTDAEGRVTMADSLSYAVKLGATKIIDFATLTGACMVALGNDIAGLFSNNHDFTKEIESAAFSAGEKVWELPLEKDYKELNKSDVADIANLANTRYGGAITAGLFLEEFVGDTIWAHLDIAGPAFTHRQLDISPKGGTGFGVRTMLNLLREKL